MLNADGQLHLTDWQAAFVGCPLWYYPDPVATGVARAVTRLPLDRVAAGGRGNGKSVGLLASAWSYARDYPGASMAVFRQERKALHDLVRMASLYFPTCDHDVLFNKQELTFFFSNGSMLTFDGLADMSSYAVSWQGRNLNWVAFEELGSWPDFDMIDLMLSNLRGEGFPNIAIYICNPGGTLHSLIYDRWLSSDPMNGEIVFADNGRPAAVFQGTFRDNPHVGEQYIESLKSATAHDPVKQDMWLNGSWARLSGTYFSRSMSDANFVDWWQDIGYFSDPTDWKFFIGLDHGTAAPAWCGLFAEAKMTTRGPDQHFYRKGDLVVVAEVATNLPDRRDRGDGSSVVELCEQISDMCEKWYDVRPAGVGDPAIFANHGQPSTIGQEYERSRVCIEPAPRAKRIPGWDIMKSRLHHATPPEERADADDPGLYINREACPQLVWELQNVTSDQKNISDVNSRQIDHAVDGCRYAVSSRVIKEGGVTFSDLPPPIWN